LPLKNGRLTAKERVFTKHMALTGNAAYAAEKAGYSGDKHVVGAQLKAKPAIAAEVAKRYQQLMFEEGLPAAYAVHMELMQDARIPAGTRAALVKTMYDQTVGRPTDAANRKEPSEMTYDELQTSIEDLKRAMDNLANQAIDVTPEHDSEPVLTGGLFD
jgi:phage terminase small subunit